MLLIVSGCGAVAQLGIALLGRICQARFGAAIVVEAGTAEELRAALAVRTAGVTIVRLAAPERRIVDALVRARRPVLLFDDGFRDAVHSVMVRHGAPFVEALRHVAQCVATLADLALAPDTLRVGPPSNTGAFVRALCHFAGIDPAELDLDAILPAPNAGTLDAITGNMPGAGGVAALSAAERGILDAVAAGYDAAVNGEEHAPIVWPPGLCFQADKPDTPVGGPLDLTGRARLLTYGPYLHLPPGGWTLRASFEVDDNRSGNRIEIAVLSGGARLGAVTLQLPIEGAYHLDVPFLVTEPRSAIEVYCATLEGAIEGNLHPLSLDLWRTTVKPSGP